MILLIVAAGTMFMGAFAANGGARLIREVIDGAGLGPTGMIVFFLAVVFILGFVLDWNIRSRRRGMGSAIFLHVAKPGYPPTQGCIALARRDLLCNGFRVKAIKPEWRIARSSIGHPLVVGRQRFRVGRGGKTGAVANG